MTQGKCKACKKAFRFNKPRRLKDAYCPYCEGKLQATNYFLQWPWEDRESVPSYV